MGSLAGFGFNFLTVLLVTPYFAMAMHEIKLWLVRLLRPHHREDFLYLLGESTDLMANFIVGNLVVSVIAGVVTWVGLTVIGVPYALALAAWVAITDLIPILGALLGAAGVAVVAFTQGPETLLWSMVLLVVYQQVENFLIAPRVMNRAVDFSPASVIIALMVGGKLAGLVGALLALPLAALTKIALRDYIVQERMDQVRAEIANGNGVMRTRRRVPASAVRGQSRLPRRSSHTTSTAASVTVPFVGRTAKRIEVPIVARPLSSVITASASQTAGEVA